MINSFVKKIPKSKKQSGSPYYFKRRRPDESDISNLKSINKVYDHIRMLDTNIKNFPAAFIEASNLIIEFVNPKKNKNSVVAEAIIKIKKN